MNLEVDVIAKYAERLLGAQLEELVRTGAPPSTPASSEEAR